MATKYYFHDTTATGGPSDEQTSWTAAVNASGYDTPRNMTTTIGSSQTNSTATHIKNTYAYHRVFCSPQLAAQTVQSQTVTLAVGVLCEDGIAAYVGWGVYVWRSGANVATIVANQTDGDVIDTTEEGRVDTATSTSQDLQNGDQICVEVWIYRDNSNPPQTKYRNFYYDGGTDPTNQSGTADAASYINFGTDTITEYTPPTTAPTFKEWSWGPI